MCFCGLMTFINLRTPPKTKKTGIRKLYLAKGNEVSTVTNPVQRTHSYWTVITEDLQSPGATKLIGHLTNMSHCKLHFLNV